MIAKYLYSVKDSKTVLQLSQEWLQNFNPDAYPFVITHTYLGFHKIHIQIGHDDQVWAAIPTFAYDCRSYTHKDPPISLFFVLEVPPQRWSMAVARGNQTVRDVPLPWRYITVEFWDITSKTHTKAAVVADRLAPQRLPRGAVKGKLIPNFLPNQLFNACCPGNGSLPASPNFNSFLRDALNAHFTSYYNHEITNGLHTPTYRKICETLGIEFSAELETFDKVLEALQKVDQSFWQNPDYSPRIFENIIHTHHTPNLTYYAGDIPAPVFDDEQRQLLIDVEDPMDYVTLLNWQDNRDNRHHAYRQLHRITEAARPFFLPASHMSHVYFH